MRTWFASVAALCLCSGSVLAGDSILIPAGSVAGAIPAEPGLGLLGQIWTQPNGSTIAGSRSVIAGNAATGSFLAGNIDYSDSDVGTPLSTWLGTDAPSLTGLPGTTSIGGLTFLMSGFLAVPLAGTVTITVESDDGFELRIGGVRVSFFDGDRGFGATSQLTTFNAVGLYPIELLSWGNASGNSGLRISASVPGFPSQVIPAAALYAQIPTPGAAVLLAIGLPAAARRRRR